MRYTTLLFDLDHTLMDSAASEQAAFGRAMAVAGIADPLPYFDEYAAINRELWAAVERHEIGPNDVRVTRFERFIAHFGLSADPIEMADAFVAGLGGNGELYDGVQGVLEELAPVARLALVTNGIGQVQRARIARLGLENYFPTIAISGELGVSKPGVEIFEWVFGALQWPDKATSLMVGDSLSSDIQGGANFGIDTCWLNADDRAAPNNGIVTHTITDVRQVTNLARGDDAT